MRELSSMPSMLARMRRAAHLPHVPLNVSLRIFCRSSLRRDGSAMIRAERVEELPVRPNMLVLRAPMRIDSVPSVSLKFVPALRADPDAGFRRAALATKAGFGFHRNASQKMWTGTRQIGAPGGIVGSGRSFTDFGSARYFPIVAAACARLAPTLPSPAFFASHFCHSTSEARTSAST